MTLSAKACALAVAVLLALSVLVVGVLNLAWPSYGAGYLEIFRSIYPGYRAMSGLGGVLVGTVYAAADGALTGFLFAWFYNRFLSAGSPAPHDAGAMSRAA